MSTNWDDLAVKAAVRAAASRGVRKGTEIVRREAVSLVVETPKTGRVYGNHQASAPGEPFASDTGQTLQSINTGFDESTLTGTVAASAENAARMEMGTEKMAPRSFMRPALENTRKEVVQTIKREVEKVS